MARRQIGDCGIGQRIARLFIWQIMTHPIPPPSPLRVLLDAMRRREGKALSADINAQLKRMLAQITLIKARSNALLKEKKKTNGS